ncbi:MAG: NAD(+) synthase [Oscillospiraceae bacterium]|nr:NAD(+) synthase [Oscillospiraceae bacterium]
MENHGFFRIMAVSPEVYPGDTEKCLTGVRNTIDEAEKRQASLLVLPELCLTSASCGDLFRMGYLLKGAEKAALETAEYTKGKDMIVCFSFPLQLNGMVYDAAALALNGEILGIVPLKPGRACPDGVFSEYCGDDTFIDLSGTEIPFGKGLVFRTFDDMEISIAVGRENGAYSGAAVIVIPDASPASVRGHADVRQDCEAVSRNECAAVVYCSAGKGETTASGVCSGQTVIAEDGKVLAEAAQFGTGCSIADVDLQALSYRRLRGCGGRSPEDPTEVFFSFDIKQHDDLIRKVITRPFLGEDDEIAERCDTVFEIQSRSLAGRLSKTGIQKAVLGVSGGLDSTLALLVSVKAMEILGRDRKHVIAVSMPCFGTSDKTKSNAGRISESLGVDFRTVDISESVSQHLKDIGHDLDTADTAYENAQARERTQVLMDLANMENALVVGTGDMSEEALGWCTFNGDHMSMYNVNCSVTKTLIRAVVSHYADNCGDPKLRDALYDIVATPVSPELKPSSQGEIAQKTEEILGPYDAHDFFLYHFIRNGSSPKKILYLAETAFEGVYTHEQLSGWLKLFFRRFFQNQFKRNCAPDGPAVGSISLSYTDWKMPGDLSADAILRDLD